MSRLVRLYPRSWRERYEDEFVSLIVERRPGLGGGIDIVRGALDAHLHPQAVAPAEPVPWTHRIPGLVALAAGLGLSAGVLGIAFGPGPDWGAAQDILGTALVLTLISLPGDYLAIHGRRIGWILGFVVGCLVAVNVLGWGIPSLILGSAAWLIVICGALTMAAIRAGIGARGRWSLLAAAVLAPFVAIAATTLLRDTIGLQLIDVTASTVALLALPYGLAWLATGLRMVLRGSPTITDPATPSFAPEVPA